MKRLIMGCAVAGLIALSAKSEARSPVAIGLSPLTVMPKEEYRTGVASWYGQEFQGNTTASGEAFDLNGFTAAHLTLPFGTTIRVTNLKNSKNILLRVNDRGPHIGRRLIDVSWAAAKRLGFVHSGTTPVRVEVVTYPKWFLSLSMAKTDY
ncbi:MAG: septal ring lytic transglycosylase RlpA family protein [Terriglobia bacterium]|jgi:rare lipoprotein A